MSEVRAGEVEVATPPPIKAPKGPGRGPMPKGMTFPAYAKKQGLGKYVVVERFRRGELPDYVGRPQKTPMRLTDWALANHLRLTTANKLWQEGYLDRLGVLKYLNLPWWEDPIEWEKRIILYEARIKSIEKTLIRVEAALALVGQLGRLRATCRYMSKSHHMMLGMLRKARAEVRDIQKARLRGLVTWGGQAAMRYRGEMDRRHDAVMARRAKVRWKDRWKKAPIEAKESDESGVPSLPTP